MPEGNERMAALETNMAYVLGVLAKREDYQSSVLKALTTIEMKQDQFIDYQKTCDAAREAHHLRLSNLEDKWKTVRGQAVMLAGLISMAIAVAGILIKTR